VERRRVSVDNAEGQEVGDSAPAQGPDAPSALHHLPSWEGSHFRSGSSAARELFSACCLLLAGKTVRPCEGLNLEWMF